MKYLLSGAAIVAALAIVAPVSAQRTGPGATAGFGTGPGVDPPGGPGPSSPLFNLPAGSPGIPGTPQSGYPSSPARLAPVMAPGVAPATISAMPAEHRPPILSAPSPRSTFAPAAASPDRARY